MRLQQTIRRILKEEVSKKYSRPNENLEKLINNWLTKLFSGANMYHIEEGKTRHDFEWCNNGLQIARLILYFDSDEIHYRTPTKERKFTSGTLWIPENIIEELLKFVPMRKNYLRYKIEEWFEDNLLDVVQNKMDRDDISIDEFEEYPKKAEVCVPPIEKPKDISIEDMIKYIEKTTLYRKVDIEKNEEEEPGWIENTYLSKLRDERKKDN